MRQYLLASTCFVALAQPALAETTISTAIQGPVRTSVVKQGAPDDILINATGTVNGTAAGGIIIDSNNKLSSQGTIQIGSISNAVGVDVAAGVTSGITLGGKIIVDEAFTPTDADNDGDLDGPFATGSNRAGIRTNGTFTGNIIVGTTGAISVEGNNSSGISLGGPLSGNFSHDGQTNVLGNNSVGVSLSQVNGNVRLAGSISAQGQGDVGVRSTGNVSGAMTIQGKIAATGYRYTTSPADPSKLDADDLLQGGPAVSIEGSVGQGIILAVPPKDQSTTDPDEDDDGIDDSKEGSASVLSYGAAPAMRIGGAGNITIGATQGTGTGFGLIVDGAIAGDGVYSNVDGNALQIGGMGGTVAIANGIGVTGTVQARSIDRSATAIRLAGGAATPELRNAGKISAGSGNTTQSVATAVDVAAGASLPVLRNSGEISAVSGSNGSAIAIVDKSGTLGLIENSGKISATGPASGSGHNVAIDLGANVSGATIRQTVVAAGFAEPAIVGDIRLGAGSDTLDVADGKVTGNVAFGSGNNRFLLSGDAAATGSLSFGAGADAVSTAGTSVFRGLVDFGGGADTLSIGGTSSFTAQLSNASGLAVSVQKGTFGIVKAASIASLNVTDGGVLAVTLDKTPGASSVLNVSGTASFGQGSKLQLNVARVDQAEGHFVVIDAGSLTGGNNLAATTDFLPFLYKGSLSLSGNQVAVDISRKSTAELGLNRSESSAFDAIYAALGKDEDIADSFLAIRTHDGLQGQVRQMLPEHAGGVFEAVTMGDRTLARIMSDPESPYKDEGGVTYWASQIGWGSSKSVGDTAGYKIGGWGANGGAEVHTRFGRFGATVAYLWGRNDDQATDNQVTDSQYTLAAHWRFASNGFQIAARGGYSFIGFGGSRFFRSDLAGEKIEREIKGKWNGNLVSASAVAGQNLWSGSFFVRPSVGIEYYKLTEDGYQEKGGGDALDLTVSKRTSDELAANGLLTAGFELGGSQDLDGYFHLELEGGRRQILSGSLGETRAHFKDGDEFVLTPEDRKSGWVARLRGIGGGTSFRFAGEVGAEQREHKVGLSARVSVAVGF
jgi:hypothetical protein